MMCRKNYIAFADAFKTAIDKNELIFKIIEIFEKDNPKFNRNKFYKALEDEDGNVFQY
jgi:hypothetical protein